MMVELVAPGAGRLLAPLHPFFLGGRDVTFGAHLLVSRLAMAALAGCMPSAAVAITHPAAAEVRPAVARTDYVVDAREMVDRLRGLGLPVSAIADVLDVERKTIYSWAGSGVPNPANADRLAQLFEILQAEPHGSLRYLHRLWERTLPNGGTLRAILLASEIDVAAARAAVEALRPASLRAMQTTKATFMLPSSDDSPASHLAVHLVADSQR